MAHKANSLRTQNGYVSTTLCLHQSIEGKSFITNTEKIFEKYSRCFGDWKGVEILEGHLMPDHIHMLGSIPPKISVSSFMGYLKGKSSLLMFDRHANLKYKYGNRKFWVPWLLYQP